MTRPELDDIMKMLYPNDLANRDLIPMIKMFSSIQNKILIDYKSFINWIKKGIKRISEDIQMSEQKESRTRTPQTKKVGDLNTTLIQNKIKKLQGKIDNMKENEKELSYQLK